MGAAGLGLVHVVRYPGAPVTPVLFGSAALLGFPLVLLALRAAGGRDDRLLLPLTCALAGLGLSEVFRLRPDLLLRQAAWISLGLCALVGAFYVARDSSRLLRYRAPSAAVGALLLLAPLAAGTGTEGVRQWLSVGAWSVQPSELAKALFIVFLAASLSDPGIFGTRGEVAPRAARKIGAVLGVVLLMLAFLAAEGDFGTSALYVAVFLAMLYASSERAAYPAAILGLVVLAGGVASLRVPTIHLRVDTWLHPWQDLTGRGYQVVQSLFALGSGGLAGRGLGLGRPDLVPAAHTDLVFAAVAEEFGFIGAAATILLFLLLTASGMAIAREARRPSARLLALGATAFLAVQALLILGGSTRLVPLTGVTLPFVSYGGSSMVGSLILLGLLLAVANERGARGTADS